MKAPAALGVAAITLSGLCADALAAPATVTLYVADVMAETPTGAGDPDTIVCRAPQPIAGGGQVGPQVCHHNYVWWEMTMSGEDLAPDGRTLIDRPTVANPTGEGDPNAVTCRTSKSAIRAPVCETNRFWADLIKNRQTIDGPTVDDPTGAGDPAAVTCQTPKFVSHGPLVEVCQTNRFWAGLVKNNQIVDARGRVVARQSDNGSFGELAGFSAGSHGDMDSGHPSQSSATP